MQIEQRDTKSLVPYESNARTHTDDQIDQIVRSIEQFGWTNPVLIDSAGGIIAGHGRVLAATQMGVAQVPCIVLDGMTPEQKRAYIIADNKLALNAGWDDDLLAQEMSALADCGFDISVVGFTTEELDALFTQNFSDKKGKTEDDYVPPIKKKEITRVGELWLLGNHRLMVGDSTSAQAYKILMADDLADMVWTDPPYNVNYMSACGDLKKTGKERIENDNMSERDFSSFCYAAFQHVRDSLKEGGCFYVACSDVGIHVFRESIRKTGLLLKQCLIWVKDSPVLGHRDYNWKHEPILYGWKEGAAHFFCGDFTLNTIVDEFTTPPDQMKKAELVEIVKQFMEAVPTTTIEEKRPTKNDLHPTMKPVALVQRMVEASSKPREIVLDPFGGSGSTMIACEKVHRSARVIELDPKFADVIIRRWQEWTEKAANLDGDGRTFAEIEKER